TRAHSPCGYVFRPGRRVAHGEAGKVVLQGIGTVEQDFPAEVSCSAQGVLGGGPGHRQRDNLSRDHRVAYGRRARLAARARQQLLELRIGRIACTEEDLVPPVCPGSAKRSADVSCTDDRNLHVTISSAPQSGNRDGSRAPAPPVPPLLAQPALAFTG